MISQCRDEISKSVTFERTSGNIPRAFVRLKDELSRCIKAKSLDNKETLKIKISGDGSRVSRISSFIVFSFNIVQDNTQFASLDHTVFCIVNCKESYDQLKDACKPVFDEINELIEAGVLVIDGESYPIEYLLGGDMKFLQIMLGLGSSLSNCSCLWCKIHKDDRFDLSKPFEFYQSCDMARTRTNLVTDSKRQAFGVKCKPLISIDPDHVPDELHLLLRIYNRLLSNLIDDAESLDDKNLILGNKSDNVGELVNKIR